MGLPSDTDEDEFQKYAYRDPTPIEDPKTFNPHSLVGRRQNRVSITLPLCMGYSGYLSNVSRMRTSLQQHKEAYYPRKKPPYRRHHRGFRVLEELVGSWANRAAR